MKLTAEEARNGWTSESLAAYMQERQKQRIAFELEQEKVNKAKCINSTNFNPHEW